MTGRISRLMVWVAILVGLASTAWAGDRFILTAPQSETPGILQRHGLTMLDFVPERDVFLVEGPEGVAPDVVISGVVNDPELDDEDDKVFMELDAVVRLSEAGLRRSLHSSTVDATRALSDRRMISYFGSRVWASYARQPAASRIRLGATHNAFGTGANVVAVIDAGVDANHPALAGGLAPGYDFTRDVPDASETADLTPGDPLLVVDNVVILDNDVIVPLNPSTQVLLGAAEASAINPSTVPETYGHGTMVASLVRLVAPNALVMPLKAFDASGSGRLFNVVRALYYARTQGASVVNLSLSTAQSSKALADAIHFLDGEKVFTVAAVGNDGVSALRYPAALPETFGVASVSAVDRRSAFSNFGNALVTLAAPGEALIAAYPGNRYALAWGTSFSTPLVSGTIALMLNVKSGVNWEEVERALLRAAPVVDFGMGAGRLDSYRAVGNAIGVVP